MKLLAKIRHVPGIADPRIQEAFQDPALKVDFNREFAGVVGLTENDASTSLQTTLSGSTQTAPTYLAEPATASPIPVSVQTPQYSHRYAGRPQELAADRRPVDAAVGRLATFSPEPLDAIVSHYDIRNVVEYLRDDPGSRSGRRRGRHPADRRRYARRASQGRDRRDSRPSATMTSAYQQLMIGLAFSIVLIYLLIVVNFQSWLDPFVIITALPAALAGIVWMLFLTERPVGAGA